MTLHRRALALLFLLAVPATVQAGVHVVQKVSTAGMTTQVEMWLQGKKARMEMASPTMGGQKMTMIIDGESRKMLTLMPGQKTYIEMSIDDMIKQARAMQGDTPKDVQVTRTGKVETINGWKSEELKVTQGPDTNFSIWVTKDLKIDGKEWMAFNREFQANDPMAKALDPDKIDGFPVRMTGTAKQGGQTAEIVMELVSADDKTLPPDAFGPPAGYQKMQMPGGNPFGPPPSK